MSSSPRWVRALLVAGALAAPCGLRPTFADATPEGAGYRVVSSTLDGGTPQVSTHAASGLRVAGTVGQPDAAVSSAASIRVEGGFWPSTDPSSSSLPFSDGFE